MAAAAGEIQCAVLVSVFQAACLKLEGQGRTGTFINLLGTMYLMKYSKTLI